MLYSSVWTRVPGGECPEIGELCRLRQRRVRLGGSRLEQVAETGAERAVVDGAADLEQQIGAAPGPAHLLRLGHAPVDQEVGRALGQRRPNPQAGPVPVGVVGVGSEYV